MPWNISDRKKYKKGTQVFAEQMQMQMQSLLERGFSRAEALELMKGTVITQVRHEHYDYPGT